MTSLQAKRDFGIRYQHADCILENTSLKSYNKVFPSMTRGNLPNFQIDGSKYGHSNKKSIQASYSTTQPTVPQKISFVKPQWALPIGDIKSDIDAKENFEALYKVQLTTSSESNSGLSDPVSGILLSVIGEDGRSIICRIHPLEIEGMHNKNIVVGNLVALSSPPFQRGSKNIVTFLGPHLEPLAAIWIAPEAGTWRLEEVTIVVSRFQKKTELEELDPKMNVAGCKVMNYVFKCEDILIGDGPFISAAELKPSMVNELADINSFCFLDAQNASYMNEAKRKEALKEYEILKISLLSYDAIFVVIGIFIASSMGITDVVNSFAVGGLGGFVYLLLLQRAVDTLPGPADFPTYTSSSAVQFSSLLSTPLNKGKGTAEENDMLIEDHGTHRQKRLGEDTGLKYDAVKGTSKGFGAPIARLSWVAVIIFLASRLPLDTEANYLSTKELLAGTVGFFVSKLALLLAVYKPLSITNKKDS